MRILLTGSNGLLGQKIIDILVQHSDIYLIATAKGEARHPLSEKFIFEPADLTDFGRLSEIFEKHKPDVIIHGGAMTQVDICEDEREACDKVNVEAVREIVKLCEKYNTHLVHISTDFIFDGSREDGYYHETDEGNPVNHYGLSKLKAETLIRNSNCSWAILRTILLYGVVYGLSRSNIVLWVKKSLEEGKNITVVNDQYRCPTLAEDLAAACISAAFKKATGIYHVCGPEKMSIFELAARVADFWHLDKNLIGEIDSLSLKQRAKRPPKTAFHIEKTQKELNYNPHSLEEGFAILEAQLRSF